VIRPREAELNGCIRCPICARFCRRVTAGSWTHALDRSSRFLATWDGSAELRELFANPACLRCKRSRFWTSSMQSWPAEGTAQPARVLINNDRIGQVHEVALAYRAELQERMGIRQAEIVTAAS